MRQQTILVTGATGFIGRVLTADLLLQGHRVVAAVRRTGAPLAPAIRQVVTGDMANDNDWSIALDGVDTVVHLAARVHVMNDQASDKLAAFRRMNVDATLHLAKQAACVGVRRFVFISSIGVNGAESVGGPFSEASAPQPHSPYAVSKHEAELALAALCAGVAMELVVLRPPLVYGAGAPGNFATLIKLVSKGVPFPLASVDNRRSMIFVDNLVHFIGVCISDPRAANQTFLVADAEPVSVAELIRALSSGLGRRARLFACPVRLLAVLAKLARKEPTYQQLCGSLEIDASKAHRLLGWTPPVRVQDGLHRSAHATLAKKRA